MLLHKVQNKTILDRKRKTFYIRLKVVLSKLQISTIFPQNKLKIVQNNGYIGKKYDEAAFILCRDFKAIFLSNRNDGYVELFTLALTLVVLPFL